jgi:RNA polymerase sigma-70 factor, ECF subfamily
VDTTGNARINQVKVPRRLRAVRDTEVDADTLLVRVGRGDRAAFEALYDTVAPVVFGVARRVVRDPQMAEDIAQEVLVEVWKLAPRFDPTKGRALSWIVTIAHRRAIDRVRSEQSRGEREERASRDAAPATTGAEVTARMEEEAVQRGLATGLGLLTPTQREAISLAFYEGRTHHEVAQLLGVPLGTAKTRIRDGLIRLRDAVEPLEVTS